MFNRILKALSVSVIVASTALVAQTVAQNAVKTSPKISVTPKVRVTEKIDNANIVTVAHSHAPLVDHLKDMGRVPANVVFHHLHLVLKSSDEQEFALQGLLDQQQDHAHGNYHQWMTPDTFGSTFGVHPADVAKIAAWMQDSGFTIEKVARGARIIDFTGTSGQIESAFHTEMHKYTVKGETRISNSTDISIPHALAPVVAGPAALNNFRPTHHLVSYKVKLDQNGKVISETPVGKAPQLTLPGDLPYDQGAFVGAADLATLYNTAPLLAQGYNGKGVSIGIVAQTDILMSDVQVYRALFGLPVNQPTFIDIGPDPGIPYTGDDGESDLDVEVSGAMAPGANIVFVAASQDGEWYDGVGAGVDSSAEYLVDNNLTDIISSSYGLDELNLGASGIAFYGALWEEAAAQGQSVFVASGDAGADEYDSDEGYSYGSYYSVDGESSTPWNVAVGGTEFNEGASFNTASTATTGTPFWGPLSTTIPYESALSYIPEQPWNDSQFGLQAQNGDYVIGGNVGTTTGVSLLVADWQLADRVWSPHQRSHAAGRNVSHL
jgi:subtilase family serine protease